MSRIWDDIGRSFFVLKLRIEIKNENSEKQDCAIILKLKRYRLKIFYLIFFYNLTVIMNIITIVNAKTKRYENNVNLTILFNLTILLKLVNLIETDYII